MFAFDHGLKASHGETIMIFSNHIRGYAYLFKVLTGQQGDLFCGKCKAFVNTAAAARLDLAAFEQENAAGIQALPGELQRVLAETKVMSEGLVLIENASGQKKAGKCKLPEGVCFVKSGRALLKSVLNVSGENE